MEKLLLLLYTTRWSNHGLECLITAVDQAICDTRALLQSLYWVILLSSWRFSYTRPDLWLLLPVWMVNLKLNWIAQIDGSSFFKVCSLGISTFVVVRFNYREQLALFWSHDYFMRYPYGAVIACASGIFAFLNIISLLKLVDNYVYSK